MVIAGDALRFGRATHEITITHGPRWPAYDCDVPHHTSSLECSSAGTFQDVKWFAFESMETTAGTWEDIPIGEVCDCCGICCSTWPQHELAEIIALCRSDRKFKGEFIVASEVQQGTREKSFNPRLVNIRNIVGLTFELKVAVVSVDKFTAKFGMPPTSLKTEAMPVQVHRYMNQDLELEEGVVMKLSNIPPDLDHQVATMYSRTESECVEVVLHESKHIREQQGQDVWKWSTGHVLQARGPALRASSMNKIFSFQEWEKKVAEEQLKREEELQKKSDSVRAEAEEEEKTRSRVRGTFTSALPAVMGGVAAPAARGGSSSGGQRSGPAKRGRGGRGRSGSGGGENRSAMVPNMRNHHSYNPKQFKTGSHSVPKRAKLNSTSNSTTHFEFRGLFVARRPTWKPQLVLTTIEIITAIVTYYT